MSHDTEAAYASSEVADMIMLNQATFFGTMDQVVYGQSVRCAKAVTSGHLLMESFLPRMPPTAILKSHLSINGLTSKFMAY